MAEISWTHFSIAAQSRRSRRGVWRRFGGSAPPKTALAAGVSQLLFARARSSWLRDRCHASCSRGSGSHGEYRHRHAFELAAVALEEAVGVAMPPP